MINMVKLVAADPFVAAGSDEILEQIAAEMHIDDLEAFADAEHRFAFFDKAGECFEL